MRTRTINGYRWSDDGNPYCTWKELPRKRMDWYEPSCQGHPVDPLSVAAKRGMTIVSLFKRCPFCGRPVMTLLKDGKKFVPVSES